MAQDRKTIEDKIDELVNEFIPIIRDAFLSLISDVTSTVILVDVIDAVEHGDVERAFKLLGLSDAAMRPLTAAIETAFEQGGIGVGRTFPRVLNSPAGRVVFRFDPRNSRAEAFLRDKSSTLVTRITNETRDNVQTI